MTSDAIAQGAVLASILAGFSVVGATTVRSASGQVQHVVVVYFTAGLLLLFSVWAGLLYFVAPANSSGQTAAVWCFAAGLGVGILCFLVATAIQIKTVYGISTFGLCLRIGEVIFGLGVALAMAVIVSRLRIK
jgi:hypothetical protein